MKKISTFLATLCIYVSGSSQIALTLDMSYGTNGTVNFPTNVTSFWNRHYFTSDNSLIVCTTEDPSFIQHFVRYNSNGNFINDLTMSGPSGEGSVLYADTNNIYPVIDDVLYKYSWSGNMDTAFGNNGGIPVPSNLSATNYLAAYYYPNNKILVRNQDNFTRYNIDGTVDITYGTNGVLTTPVTTSSPLLNEKIDINYFFESSGGRRKINITTGTLDLSYGNNGYAVVSNVPGYLPFDPEAVTSNSEIITLLYNTGNSFDYAISKTKADGNLDNAFGSSGMKYLPEIYNSKNLYYGLTLGMDNYTDKTFIPLTVRLQQGSDIDSKVGIACYSATTGNIVSINGTNVLETDLYGGGNVSVRISGNYLYLFTQSSVSRYVISENTLEIQEAKTNNQISFENPFRNELTINTKEKIKQFEIYDENGRLLIKEKNKNQLNTSQLDKGIYIVKLTTESNKVISKKAMKN